MGLFQEELIFTGRWDLRTHQSSLNLVSLVQNAAIVLPGRELCSMLNKSNDTLNYSEVAFEPILSSGANSCWNSSIYYALSSLPLWRFQNCAESTEKKDDVWPDATQASKGLVIQNGFLPGFPLALRGTSPESDTIILVSFIQFSKNIFFREYLSNKLSHWAVLREKTLHSVVLILPTQQIFEVCFQDSSWLKIEHCEKML